LSNRGYYGGFGGDSSGELVGGDVVGGGWRLVGGDFCGYCSGGCGDGGENGDCGGGGGSAEVDGGGGV
jgi:hypothetical protein